MRKRPRVLVVDDELAMREALKDWLMEDGYHVDVASSGTEALELIEKMDWDVVLLDLKMPGMDGIQTLNKIKQISPESEVIIITAYATVDTAVKAMKEGAFDYLVKPFDPDELQIQIRKIMDMKALILENVLLKEQLDQRGHFDEIVGRSPAMQEIFDLILRVAPSDSTVLITGESGTGKELIANAIHANSHRCYGPFIVINCGALPETLLESELFGYEKGAFTGADYTKRGRIELANQGTLFLDEIGDITPKTQVGLLRVLQQKEISRLGSEESIPVDVRIIAATNKDLKKAIGRGDFREDLFYRLNVIRIHVPPLRERKEDIGPLTEYFIKKFAMQMNKDQKRISPEAMRLLLDYNWPGNIRELQNVVERAMVVGTGRMIRPEDLPFAKPSIPPSEYPDSLKMMEKAHIERILNKTQWNITRAAKILDIDRQTLYNKIKRYGLRREAKG